MKGAGLHTVHTVDDMHSSGQSRLRITYLLSLKRHALVSIPNFLHIFHNIWNLRQDQRESKNHYYLRV
jgi:hypothetical protein